MESKYLADAYVEAARNVKATITEKDFLRYMILEMVEKNFPITVFDCEFDTTKKYSEIWKIEADVNFNYSGFIKYDTDRDWKYYQSPNIFKSVTVFIKNDKNIINSNEFRLSITYSKRPPRYENNRFADGIGNSFMEAVTECGTEYLDTKYVDNDDLYTGKAFPISDKVLQAAEEYCLNKALIISHQGADFRDGEYQGDVKITHVKRYVIPEYQITYKYMNNSYSLRGYGIHGWGDLKPVIVEDNMSNFEYIDSPHFGINFIKYIIYLITKHKQINNLVQKINKIFLSHDMNLLSEDEISKIKCYKIGDIKNNF